MAELSDKISDSKPELRAAVMAELTKMLQEMGNEGLDLSEFLDKEVAEAIQNAALTPALTERLSSNLKICKEDIVGKLKRLHQAKLTEKKFCEKSAALSKADSSELAAFLNENAGGLTPDDIAVIGQMLGISRGGSDAEMTWTEGTSESRVGFKEDMLPLSRIPSVRKSMRIGVSHASPEKNKEIVPVGPGALSGATEGGGSALTPEILPRHRRVIRRYFKREKEKPKPPPIMDEVWSGWG